MAALQTVRCASGSCFKDGSLQCAKCRVTYYCSKTCQKNHWAKHNKHCSAHKPFPKGTFEFLKLNREIRDKVSCVRSLLKKHLLTHPRSMNTSSSLATHPTSSTSTMTSPMPRATASVSETFWTRSRSV